MLTAAAARTERAQMAEKSLDVDGARAFSERIAVLAKEVMEKELWSLCAAAVFSSPTKELKFDVLKTEVEVAHDAADSVDRIIDEIIKSLGQSLEQLSTDDSVMKAWRQRVAEILKTRTITPNYSLKRFFCDHSLPLVDIEGSIWRFEYSPSKPDRITLKLGASQLDILKKDETLEDAAATEKDQAPKEKRKSRRSKAVGALKPSVEVSEKQLAISLEAPVIAKERTKLAESGKYSSALGYGNDRPADLSVVNRIQLGGVLRGVFADLVPPPENEAKLEALRLRFQAMIDREYRNPSITVKFFGSAINRLGFKSSDVDIILEIANSKHMSPKAIAQTKSVWRLASMLRRYGMHNVLAIAGARVPICKFEDPESGLSCDMNFGNMLGRYNSELLRMYTDLDPRVRPLIVLLKSWAKNRDVNDAADGGTISSYGYSLMVINYMQVRGILPSLQKLFEGPRPERMIIPRQNAKRFRKPAYGKNAQQSDQDDSDWERQNIFVNMDIVVDAARDKRLISSSSDLSSNKVATSLEQVVTENYSLNYKRKSAPASKILLADLYFVDDLNHISLAAVVSRASSMSEEDVWAGPDGVAALFYDFMRYYAWDFSFRADQIVSIRKGQLLQELSDDLSPWATRTGMILLVEDPFQLDRNVTGGVSNLQTVVREMRRALQVMGSEEADPNNATATFTIAKLMEPTVNVTRKRSEKQMRAQNQRARNGNNNHNRNRQGNSPPPQRQQRFQMPAASNNHEPAGPPAQRPLLKVLPGQNFSEPVHANHRYPNDLQQPEKVRHKPKKGKGGGAAELQQGTSPARTKGPLAFLASSGMAPASPMPSNTKLSATAQPQVVANGKQTKNLAESQNTRTPTSPDIATIGGANSGEHPVAPLEKRIKTRWRDRASRDDSIAGLSASLSKMHVKSQVMTDPAPSLSNTGSVLTTMSTESPERSHRRPSRNPRDTIVSHIAGNGTTQ
ncbi:hypothetical protein HKX48_004627 [Thoreauomyces humboldtii]|nr:hypothetical protein HKX48_004627 [Thoreauomyces humboldtii]